MPKILRFKKPPPEGWELIEPTLKDLEDKMREAENETHEGKTKSQIMWPIIQIHHQRSRYIYEMYVKRKAISKKLYEWCIKMGYADVNLISKWKRVRITFGILLLFVFMLFLS
jgi:bud site selection protein 31